MRLVSFNVNGIRAILKKGFADVFRSLDADVFFIEETKYSDDGLHIDFPFSDPGYQLYWTDSKVRKGYSGVACLAKREPLSVAYGLEGGKYDDEGRVITLEYPSCYVVGAYVPNSGEGLKRLPFRMGFEDDMRRYLTELDKKKPVIYTGDLNVAHEEIDIKNPAANRHNAGFTDEERAKFGELLKVGFADTFRSLHPEEVKYSWWSYRFNARATNAGWRIDYFLVSDRILPKVSKADILDGVQGSDHCPVELEIDI